MASFVKVARMEPKTQEELCSVYIFLSFET